jgi:hypothetical protein
MCLLTVKISCTHYEGTCEERGKFPLILEYWSCICSIHIKYLLQYKYFYGWNKWIFRGVKGCGRG